MQIDKNKSGGVLSILFGGSLFPQNLFFDDRAERNEEFYRSYIFPYFEEKKEEGSASKSSPDSESADYSFANLRPFFEGAMRESGMPEDSKDARMLMEAYNAFDTMAVGLEKKIMQGASFSKADLAVPFAQFASALNGIAKARNAGR